MNRVIWKWEVLLVDAQTIPMPKGAKVLTVQLQDDAPCLWAEVDPDAQKEIRYFRVFGTGNPMPREMGYSDTYIGTWQQGQFVWHLYEQTGI